MNKIYFNEYILIIFQYAITKIIYLSHTLFLLMNMMNLRGFISKNNLFIQLNVFSYTDQAILPNSVLSFSILDLREQSKKSVPAYTCNPPRIVGSVSQVILNLTSGLFFFIDWTTWSFSVSLKSLAEIILISSSLFKILQYFTKVWMIFYKSPNLILSYYLPSRINKNSQEIGGCLMILLWGE